MDSLDSCVELRTAFQLFDKDKDGIISRNELKKAIIELGHDCKEEDIDEIFKLYDCQNGIDFHTFLKIATEKRFCQKSLDLDLIETFKIFDRDNMNYITSVDLKYILKNFCKTLKPNEIDMLMKQVDPRGDGEITFEQFVKLILMK